jgi:microcystin-dependent protein
MAYIGNGRTLLVLGSNVRDDIVPDNSTTTFTLSQEVPGGYEGNVYVFKQSYITERLITNSISGAITTPGGASGSTWTIQSSNASVAAALSDIKEGIKLYADVDQSLTLSGFTSPNTVNNGTFKILGCTYDGSTITITLARPGSQGVNAVSGDSLTVSRGYSGFWEVLEPDVDYTIGGTGANLNKQITFSKIPKLDDKIYVVHKGDATYNLVPSDNSVGPNQLSQNLRDFTKQIVGSESPATTPANVVNGTNTEFVLTQDAVNSKAILVSVNGSVQEGEEWNGTSVTADSDYALRTDLVPNRIKFRVAPASGAKIRVLHLGFSTVSRRAVLSPGQSGPVAAGSIGTAELATSAVIDSKIASGAVTNIKLAADSVTADKILLNNNTSLRSYRSNGTTIFSPLTLNSSDQLVLNTPTTAQLAIAGTTTVNISSTQIAPETTSTIALGSSTKKFTDVHLSGQLNSATANVTGNITVGGTVDGVDVSALNTTVSNLQTLVNNLVPIGTMMIWPAGGVPNSNWVLCDGSSYFVTAYPALHAAIGYAYGGSGANFNLPDMRRRVPIGSGSGTPIGNTDGILESSRSLTHTHTVPAHAHGMSNHTHSLPAHFHGMGAGATLNITSSGSHTTTIDIGNHTHTHTLTDSGQLSTSSNGTGITASQGAHSHGGATAAADPAHSHTGTTNQAGSHDHALRVEGAAGSGTVLSLKSSASTGITDRSDIDDDGIHTHTFTTASANINHAHVIYAEAPGITVSDPTHNHTIAAHSHTLTINALDAGTNRQDTGGSHTHLSGAFSGAIGLVTGGVDGNAAMTSGTPSTNMTENSSVLTSGTAINVPYTVINYIIRAS